MRRGERDRWLRLRLLRPPLVTGTPGPGGIMMGRLGEWDRERERERDERERSGMMMG